MVPLYARDTRPVYRQRGRAAKARWYHNRESGNTKKNKKVMGASGMASDGKKGIKNEEF